MSTVKHKSKKLEDGSILYRGHIIRKHYVNGNKFISKVGEQRFPKQYQAKGYVDYIIDNNLEG